MEIIDQIKSQYSFLSQQEQKVALAVIQRGDLIQRITIQSLAKELSVSSSTISRFVRKLGCESFVDFKIQLTQNEPLTNDAGIQGMTDKEEQTSVEVYQLYQDVITRTQQKLNPQAIKKLIKWLKSAKRVFIYGLGSSGYTAEEFGQRLIRMGIQTTTATESHMMLITSKIMNKGDLVIGLSNSGNTNELNHALSYAKENGTHTAAITSANDSKIVSMSELTLVVEDSIRFSSKRFINSQFAMTYLIDVLSMLLLEDEQYAWNMQRTVETILHDKLKQAD